MPQAQDHIEIPTNVLVHCPKVAYKLARMGGCTDCTHFAGLEDRFPGSAVPFANRYALLCRHDPVKRDLKELSE